MIKVQLDEELDQIEIIENDRGDWEVSHSLPEVGCYHLTGFGGENSISIHIMQMQDKTTDFVVVHASCDNPARVIQQRVKTGFDVEGVNFALNTIIARVCTYPEVIPC